MKDTKGTPGTSSPVAVEDAVLKAEQALKAAFGEDVAGRMIENAKAEKARQDAESRRKAILEGVTVLLSSAEAELKKLLPAGRTLVIFHRPAKMDGEKVAEEAGLSFNVDIGGGSTSTGSTRKGSGSRASGVVLKITLDGATFEAPSYRKALDLLNEKLEPEHRYEIPSSSFNARNPVNAMVTKLAGRLTVEESKK